MERKYLVPIYKEKGNIRNCEKYRGIELMSHTLKVYERVMDRRLKEYTEITETQFGSGQEGVQRIASLRQLVEKYREKWRDYICFFLSTCKKLTIEYYG